MISWKFFWALNFIPLLIWNSLAYANLQVFPTRVLINDKKRTAHLSLKHIGTAPTTYRISTIFYKMNSDGTLKIEKTPQNSDRSGIKLLHYSPREITLQPGREQVFRILAYFPKDILPGEYRAHLNFEPIGTQQDTSGDSKSLSGPDKIAMQLSARIGVSVPVYMRHGKVNNTVQLTQLFVETDKATMSKRFSATIKNQGNGFPWGTMQVFFIPKGEKPIQVGIFHAITCYSDSRTVKYPIQIPDGVKLSNGTLKVVYHEPQEEGGKIFAEAETQIN